MKISKFVYISAVNLLDYCNVMVSCELSLEEECDLVKYYFENGLLEIKKDSNGKEYIESSVLDAYVDANGIIHKKAA